MTSEPSLLDRLPIARWGWYDLIMIGGPMLLATVALATQHGWPRLLAIVPGLLCLQLLWFFRDPPRTPPDDSQAYLSPADGTISDVTELDYYEFFDAPAIKIGIFLSVFNVHISRAARTAKVVDTHYKPGEYLNALKPESAARNESMWLGMEEPDGRRLAIRQISGLIARRIVCEPTPGDTVQAGAKFGMIKFGSRTELIVPAGTPIVSTIGDKVLAGQTILARIAPQSAGP